MPRIGRFVSKYESAVYHVISRTALPGLPMEDTDKGKEAYRDRHFLDFSSTRG
jgi:hypothetical protein